MNRPMQIPPRLRRIVGAGAVVGLLAAGVAGCGGGGSSTGSSGETVTKAPTVQGEEKESGGPIERGGAPEAALLLEETKARANQIVEEAQQQGLEIVAQAKADSSLGKSELLEAKQEANEVIQTAKESAKLAIEGAKAKAREQGG
jgi:vacuolar-type H+-ATPase subunit H